MTVTLQYTAATLEDAFAMVVADAERINAKGAAAPKATTPKETKAKDTPKVDPTPPTEPVSDTTPDQAKDDGNSQGLTAEEFSKLGLQFAKECGDNGAKLKDIWASYQQADGTPVNRLGAVQEKDYDAMIADMEAAKLA